MPAWGPLALKGFAAASKTLPVKPIVDHVAKSAGEARVRRQTLRRDREHAERLARQVGGKLAKVSLRGSPELHLVVWKDGVPFAAFPHVEGDLADLPELQHIPEELLYDPRPNRLPRQARRAAKRKV
jgi:hypothetical protein